MSKRNKLDIALSENKRLREAIAWMGKNWNASAPDDGDHSNVPEHIRDLMPYEPTLVVGNTVRSPDQPSDQSSGPS